MTSMLLNGKAETIQKAKDLIELTPHGVLAQLPSPRIVNAHMKLSDSPNDVTALKCKVIYTMRDPKDVAVFLYKLYYNKPTELNDYMGSLENYLQLFLDGTGTNWTYEMTSMLLNGKAETIQKAKDLMELTPHGVLAQLPSPRIVNAHMKLSDSPNDVTALKCKVIYTMRDPKDVAVSLYKLYYNKPTELNDYMGSLENYLQLFLDGTVDSNGIFEHWRDAEKYFTHHPEIPVHVQYYEEAIKDPKALSDFLGLQRHDDLCRAIAEKCSFARMKIDKEPFAIKVDGENFLYRKGTVGDWKNWFNDQMLEDYLRVYEDKMAGSRFYTTYARSNH